MPVRRLRSLAEAENPVRYRPGDPRLLAAIRDVWALADRLCPVHFPPGVYRHRSIEDLNRQREQWDAARIRELREKLKLG